MNDPKNLAAGLALGLRSSLARVELAASQLTRELRTPTARELARVISAAVRETDRDIDVIVALLLPLARPRGRSDDLRAVFRRLGERVAPVLDAAGTSWEEPVAPGSVRLQGDPVATERAALALARAGSRLAGAGGRLRLGLVGDDSRYGVTLECWPPEGRSVACDPRDAFAAVASVAASRAPPLPVNSSSLA